MNNVYKFLDLLKYTILIWFSSITIGSLVYSFIRIFLNGDFIVSLFFTFILVFFYSVYFMIPLFLLLALAKYSTLKKHGVILIVIGVGTLALIACLLWYSSPAQLFGKTLEYKTQTIWIKTVVFVISSAGAAYVWCRKFIRNSLL